MATTLLSWNPNHAFLALLDLMITYSVVWILYARYFHPLSKYPGPFLASFTRLWLILDVAKGKADLTQRALHAKYGHIVRIAPNELSISDPEAIKVIYGSHTGFHKTDFYLPFRADFSRYPDHFTNTDEKQHATRRRIVNSLYSISNVIQMEEKVDQCSAQLLEKLSKYAQRGQTVELTDWSKWYAFDVIGQLFHSRMFGFMEKAADFKGYIQALDLLVPVITVALVMPTWMRPVFLISSVMIPRMYRALTAFKYIAKESQACVAERQRFLASNPEKVPEDMLQSYFDIFKTKGKEKDFGLVEIQTDSYGAFLAGSDTTASAITAVLYYLLRSPKSYQKLVAEIDDAYKDGFMSPMIQYNEAVGLPYLVACIKESMRLHPSIGMQMPRHVPKNGCIIAGQWFAGGTRVGMNAAVVQRDKTVFGEDPDSFVPERWLGPRAARMERYMLHFGAGTRTCIGKNISLCEIYKIVPQLLRTFQIELAEPGKEWQTHNYWFHKQSDVRVRLRLRHEVPVAGSEREKVDLDDMSLAPQNNLEISGRHQYTRLEAL